MKMRTNMRSRGKFGSGSRLAMWGRSSATLGLAVAAIGFLPTGVGAQTVASWTYDISNGNGSGTGGNRIFNLNALLNGGLPFVSGSIAGGLTVNVNGIVVNTSTNANRGDILLYNGSVGPTYYAGNNPVSYFTVNTAFLNNSGLEAGDTDTFTLGAFDASAWLNTLNPLNTAPILFSGSFSHTLTAEIDDQRGNLVASLPDITPGSPTGPTVLFTAIIGAAPIVVPEPGSISLVCAFGVAGTVFATRRRK